MFGNFTEKLIRLLEDCEDMESMEDLYSLSSIMKMLIFLNDSAIYEFILQDEFFPIVVGILEYDRDFPKLKANHRNHLQNNAHFKQVLPISNKEIVQKIKQTYRIQFLKDVVLARLLDDSTFSALNSLVFFNHMDIVSHFQQDNEYLEGLFQILSSDEHTEDKKKEVVLFLQELCSIAKNLQAATRAGFYRALAQHGLFAIFEYTLADDDIAVRLAATAILWTILEHDSSLVRSFSVAQMKGNTRPLIDFIVSRFIEEEDPGLRSQHADIIRIMLDTSGLDTTEGIIPHAADSDSDDFLNSFYDTHIAKFAAPVETLDTVMQPEDKPCLELFEFIRKENLKSLITNIVQNHRKLFEDIAYTDTFKLLVLRHEQNQDVPVTNGKDHESVIPDKAADGWSRLDQDEEAYFDSIDDEDMESSKDRREIARARSAAALSPLSPLSMKLPEPSASASAKELSPSLPKAMPLVAYSDDDDHDQTAERGVANGTVPSLSTARAKVPAKGSDHKDHLMKEVVANIVKAALPGVDNAGEREKQKRSFDVPDKSFADVEGVDVNMEEDGNQEGVDVSREPIAKRLKMHEGEDT
ncbi:Platinum sensitivity protein [Irineochytrium annulatum]|nr:Platinum sensitivity protein [Irineochytrium annulatum]